MFKSKWDKWYDNQNPTTQAWLDSQSKETDKFALSIAIPSLTFGILFGILIGLGL